MMKQLGIMLGTSDVKVLGEFYEKLLGEAEWKQEGWYGWMKSGHLMIGAHSEVTGKNATQCLLVTLIFLILQGNWLKTSLLTHHLKPKRRRQWTLKS